MTDIGLTDRRYLISSSSLAFVFLFSASVVISCFTTIDICILQFCRQHDTLYLVLATAFESDYLTACAQTSPTCFCIVTLR